MSSTLRPDHLRNIDSSRKALPHIVATSLGYVAERLTDGQYVGLVKLGTFYHERREWLLRPTRGSWVDQVTFDIEATMSTSDIARQALKRPAAVRALLAAE